MKGILGLLSRSQTFISHTVHFEMMMVQCFMRHKTAWKLKGYPYVKNSVEAQKHYVRNRPRHLSFLNPTNEGTGSLDGTVFADRYDNK